MNRRSFLRSSSLAAGAVLVGPANYAEASIPVSLPRCIPINRNWLFHPATTPGDTEPNFDDRAFSSVVLPHTNKVFPWHSFDDVDYEFISTYRRHLRLSGSARGKRVFVDFEGAMTASTVWINGRSLGEYKGGYTPFSFELTPHTALGRIQCPCRSGAFAYSALKPIDARDQGTEGDGSSQHQHSSKSDRPTRLRGRRNSCGSRGNLPPRASPTAPHLRPSSHRSNTS